MLAVFFNAVPTLLKPENCEYKFPVSSISASIINEMLERPIAIFYNLDPLVYGNTEALSEM